MDEILKMNKSLITGLNVLIRMEMQAEREYSKCQVEENLQPNMPSIQLNLNLS